MTRSKGGLMAVEDVSVHCYQRDCFILPFALKEFLNSMIGLLSGREADCIHVGVTWRNWRLPLYISSKTACS